MPQHLSRKEQLDHVRHRLNSKVPSPRERFGATAEASMDSIVSGDGSIDGDSYVRVRVLGYTLMGNWTEKSYQYMIGS